MMRSSAVSVAVLSLVLVGACGDDDGGSRTPDAPADAVHDAVTPDDAAACDATACGALIPSGDVSSASWGDVDASACPASQAAHDALNDCACVNTNAQNGCANICDANQNGTGNPNFCNGVPALPSCLNCLQTMCGAEIGECAAN